MWIVTKEHNAYDQMGEYFVAAYNEKPSFDDLKKLLPDRNDVTIGKLTKGGGRQNMRECSWYYLREVREGERL